MSLEADQNILLERLREQGAMKLPRGIGDIAAGMIAKHLRTWACPHCGVEYQSSWGRMTCGEPACMIAEAKLRGEYVQVSEIENARRWMDARMQAAGVPMAYRHAQLTDFPNGNEHRWQNRRSVRIHGAVGRGKTHMAVALLKAAIELGTTESGTSNRVPTAFVVKFARAHDYLKRIKSTFRRSARESENDVLYDFSHPEVLVLDDVGAEASSEYGWAELLALLEARAWKNRTTILTTNKTLMELYDLEPRIASRLKEWRAIELAGVDRRGTA